MKYVLVFFLHKSTSIYIATVQSICGRFNSNGPKLTLVEPMTNDLTDLVMAIAGPSALIRTGW